jgi:hypothetical protein
LARSTQHVSDIPAGSTSLGYRVIGPGNRRKTQPKPMKFRDVPQSGSRGNTVASRNCFGPFQRERVSPDHPGTAAQQGVWGSMAEVSWLWNHLPEEQWPAWRKLALQVRSRPKYEVSRALGGLPGLRPGVAANQRLGERVGEVPRQRLGPGRGPQGARRTGDEPPAIPAQSPLALEDH